MNKQFLWNVGSFIIILVLLIITIDSKSSEGKLKAELSKWKSTAISEQEVPKISDDAKNFVKALNRAKHKNFLTGIALEEYNKAINEEESHDTDNHKHINFGEQKTKILQVTTEKQEEDQAQSVVLYQVIYESPFNQEDFGVVDQRVLTLLMDINWIKEKKNYKVRKYTMKVLNDNLDEYLSSLAKKGDDIE